MMGLGWRRGERAQCIYIQSAANREPLVFGAQGHRGDCTQGSESCSAGCSLSSWVLAQEHRSFRLSSPPPPRPSTTSLKNAFILGTQRWHSLAQMPPREVTLIPLTRGCVNQTSIQKVLPKDRKIPVQGVKIQQEKLHLTKIFQHSRHLEKDVFDVLYNVLITALLDTLGL